MSRKRHAFTLLELLAVITLMSIAVSMAVFRLDGISDRASLTSAAGQIESIVRLAQMEARLSGKPSLLTYIKDKQSLLLQRPIARGATRGWDDGRGFQLGGRAMLHAIIRQAKGTKSASSVLIDGDGRFAPHGLILQAHDHYLALLLEPSRALRSEVSNMPMASNYAELLQQVESSIEDKKSTLHR